MEKSLGIAWPLTNEMIHSQFVFSWIMMKKPSEFKFFIPRYPYYIDKIRNDLVEQALDSGTCTHLLMMDTDQVYPEDTIVKLMQYDLPIVAAKVHRRYPPFDPIMYAHDGTAYYMMSDSEWLGKEEPIEVAATGTGCVLFDMNIFMDIEYPWFETTDIRLGRMGKTVGEDVSFYEKARKAGYKIYVDPSIKIGHMSTLEITEETYQLFRKITGGKG